MSLYDFNSPRLFVDHPLNKAVEIELNASQRNYLVNVLRLKPNGTVLIFNGVDGEWLAQLTILTRKKYVLQPQHQTRIQPAQREIHYAFAPIKSARLDYMVQKAIEMGVSKLIPVITCRTQGTKFNMERCRANVNEAAEQCGILNLAQIEPVIKLEAFCSSLSSNQALIFCDENAAINDPIATLRTSVGDKIPCVLIGPEGGFDDNERQMLLKLPQILSISLGPRILRADTAAIAALSAVQVAIGDWR